MLRESVLRHLWLIWIAGTFVYATAWWVRGLRKMATNPALKPGYRRLIGQYLIFANIPSLMLGAWLEPPARPLPLSLIQFSAAFGGILVVYWIAAWYRLFSGGGAEQMAAHPGLPQFPSGNARAIKIKCAIALTIALLAPVLAFGHGFLLKQLELLY